MFTISYTDRVDLNPGGEENLLKEEEGEFEGAAQTAQNGHNWVNQRIPFFARLHSFGLRRKMALLIEGMK